MEIHKDMLSQNGKSNLIYCYIQAPIPRIYEFPLDSKKQWLMFIIIGSAQKGKNII